MTTEATPGNVPLNDLLGLAPERAAFERWRDIERPSLMRHTIVYSDLADLQTEAIAWDAWNACWPTARAAIYSAEQAQIEAPLRTEIDRLRAEVKALRELWDEAEAENDAMRAVNRARLLGS